MHAWTSGISLRLLREARSAGARVVFTYHTPAVSCARGSLMIYGRQVCDGALYVDRCSRCLLQSQRVPLPLGWALGELPRSLGRAIGAAGLKGRAWTALRTTELMGERHEAFGALLTEADALIAVQDWVHELLLFLGAPREKVTLSRLALPELESEVEATVAMRRQRPPSSSRLRVAYFGRVEAIKGPDVVVRALLAMPGVPVELHVFGNPQGEAGRVYRSEMQRLAAADDRIRFLGAVPTAEVRNRMSEYDLVVVPSVWMETGPLVVPEAMSVGVPVIGSRLGGIPSFIRDGVDGLLVEPGDVSAWSAALMRLVNEPQLLATLRANVQAQDRMDRIVDEMQLVYARVMQIA
jgi:glycosyltransferase involved in cell wall biosynthesis